jgi:hypothetical protein
MTKVSTTASYRIPGVYEPIEYIVETHTICDTCGSANISYKANAHLPEAVSNGFALVFFISLFGFIALGFGAILFRLYKYNFIIFGIGVISVIDILVFSCITAFVERNNNKEPKCNTCGNEHIT